MGRGWITGDPGATVAGAVRRWWGWRVCAACWRAAWRFQLREGWRTRERKATTTTGVGGTIGGATTVRPRCSTPRGILHPRRSAVLSFLLLSGCHGTAIPFLSAARVARARRLTPGAGRARCERRRQKCRRKPPRSSSTLCIDPLSNRGVGFFLA